MEDKYLETISDEVKSAVRFAIFRNKQTSDPSFLDIAVEHTEKYIKFIEESDKRSESMTEFCHTLRWMRDEMVDENGRNSEIGKL